MRAEKAVTGLKGGRLTQAAQCLEKHLLLLLETKRWASWDLSSLKVNFALQQQIHNVLWSESVLMLKDCGFSLSFLKSAGEVPGPLSFHSTQASSSFPRAPWDISRAVAHMLGAEGIHVVAAAHTTSLTTGRFSRWQWVDRFWVCTALRQREARRTVPAVPRCGTGGLSNARDAAAVTAPAAAAGRVLQHQ